MKKTLLTIALLYAGAHLSAGSFKSPLTKGGKSQIPSDMRTRQEIKPKPTKEPVKIGKKSTHNNTMLQYGE